MSHSYTAIDFHNEWLPYSSLSKMNTFLSDLAFNFCIDASNKVSIAWIYSPCSINIQFTNKESYKSDHENYHVEVRLTKFMGLILERYICNSIELWKKIDYFRVYLPRWSVSLNWPYFDNWFTGYDLYNLSLDSESSRAYTARLPFHLFCYGSVFRVFSYMRSFGVMICTVPVESQGI